MPPTRAVFRNEVIGWCSRAAISIHRAAAASSGGKSASANACTVGNRGGEPSNIEAPSNFRAWLLYTSAPSSSHVPSGKTGDAPCHHVHQLLTERLADIDRQIADLQALRATLSRQREHTETADPSTCAADTVCRYV